MAKSQLDIDPKVHMVTDFCLFAQLAHSGEDASKRLPQIVHEFNRRQPKTPIRDITEVVVGPNTGQLRVKWDISDGEFGGIGAFMDNGDFRTYFLEPIKSMLAPGHPIDTCVRGSFLDHTPPKKGVFAPNLSYSGYPYEAMLESGVKRGHFREMIRSKVREIKNCFGFDIREVKEVLVGKDAGLLYLDWDFKKFSDFENEKFNAAHREFFSWLDFFIDHTQPRHSFIMRNLVKVKDE